MALTFFRIVEAHAHASTVQYGASLEVHRDLAATVALVCDLAGGVTTPELERTVERALALQARVEAVAEGAAQAQLAHAPGHAPPEAAELLGRLEHALLHGLADAELLALFHELLEGVEALAEQSLSTARFLTSLDNSAMLKASQAVLEVVEAMAANGAAQAMRPLDPPKSSDKSQQKR